MKKAKSAQVGKSTYQVAKSYASTGASSIDSKEKLKLNQLSDNVVSRPQTADELQIDETELMGENNINGSYTKSEALNKNLNQMVSVLRLRLAALNDTSKLRNKLCEEDLNANSDKMSEQAPKINGFDDFHDTQKQHKDNFKSSLYRENLVSAEGVFIDPVRLVIKTKLPTETAKKLEYRLDDGFGVGNLKDLTGKKTKSAHRAEKSRKSEQQKYEAKRQMRLKLEKDLQSDVDSYVTRSVLDGDLQFSAPDFDSSEPMDRSELDMTQFPIPIRWPARDSRSHNPENVDGEMDPDLLLRYGVERINLPSGEGLFIWLAKQQCIQQYFIFLFWMIKVKLFQNVNPDTNDEIYLLKKMSGQYSLIIEMLGERAHEEHEKDFVYKYFPYILCNAVYYTFYYICPGSRHLYTKGFKKTIYMQTIQIMYGMQLCPASVKVTWPKLFPEDIVEDDEGEEVSDSFPVPIALQGAKRLIDSVEHKALAEMSMKKSSLGASSKRKSPSANPATPLASPGYEKFNAGSSSPFFPPSRGDNSRPGLLATDFDRSSSPSQNRGHRSTNMFASSVDFLLPSSIVKSTENYDKIGNRSTSRQSAVLNQSSDTSDSGDSRPSTTASTVNVNVIDFKKTSRADIAKQLSQKDPLFRTHLQGTLEKPRNLPTLTPKQIVEPLNAKIISPLVQDFLKAPQSCIGQDTIVLRRTVPVNWCPVGGIETYTKRVVQKELHDELSSKAEKCSKDFKQLSFTFHKRGMKIKEKVESMCDHVLKSGPTKISRFSLDLIKRQKMVKIGGTTGTVPINKHEFSESPNDQNLADIILAAHLDDPEFDNSLLEY